MSQRRQREQGTRLEIYPKILAGSNQVDLISLSGPNKVSSSGPNQSCNATVGFSSG